jgi:beta-lactamase regulating signal transducer with metallopeptidase domain
MITLATLIPIAAKGALVLLAATIIALLLARRSAASRHMVWTGSLFALLLLPFLSFAMPALRVPSVAPLTNQLPLGVPRLRFAPARDDTPVAPEPAPVPAVAEGQITPAAVEAAPAEVRPAVLSSRPPAEVAVLVWLIGAGSMIGWLILGHIRAHAIARISSPSLAPEWTGLLEGACLDAGVIRRVEIRESEYLAVPITVGFFRPIVVVPAEGRDWSSEHRADVLVHELAHIARRDTLTHSIGWVACALHWFNPLAWLALYRARVEREHACDDVVLSAGARPSTYAQELLTTAQLAQLPLGAGAASLAMARKSQLTGRLLAILDPKRHRSPANVRGAGFLAAIGLLVVLPIAALAPAAVEAAEALEVSAGGEVAAADLAPIDEAPIARRRATVAALADQIAPRVLTGMDADPSLELRPVITQAPTALTVSTVKGDTPCPRAKTGAREVKLTRSMKISGQGNAEDGSGNSWTVWSGVDCYVKVQLYGKVKFNAEENDVSELSRGAKIEFTYGEGSTDRVYTVTEEGGDLVRRYTVNGREAPITAEVDQWRAELVLAYIRQSGYEAEGRAKRILAARGVDGILAEIDQITSDYTAGRYYGAVISSKMDDATTARVVTAAGRSLESDYELGKVLKAVPAAALAGPAALGAYVQATESIESDYELGRTLGRVLSAGPQDAEVTRALLKRASSMESDHELAQLLLGLAATGTVQGEAKAVYIDAIPAIESDYEKQRVLTAIVPSLGGNTPLLAHSLKVAATIESDHSTSEYLKQFLAVTALSGDLIAPFFAAAATIESDYNQQEVLVAALGRSSSPEVVTQVLHATKRIESDHSQAEVLMAAIRRGVTPEQKTLLKDVARGGIESSYDRGRVLDLLER